MDCDLKKQELNLIFYYFLIEHSMLRELQAIGYHFNSYKMDLSNYFNYLKNFKCYDKMCILYNHPNQLNYHYSNFWGSNCLNLSEVMKTVLEKFKIKDNVYDLYKFFSSSRIKLLVAVKKKELYSDHHKSISNNDYIPRIAPYCFNKKEINNCYFLKHPLYYHSSTLIFRTYYNLLQKCNWDPSYTTLYPNEVEEIVTMVNIQKGIGKSTNDKISINFLKDLKKMKIKYKSRFENSQLLVFFHPEDIKAILDTIINAIKQEDFYYNYELEANTMQKFFVETLPYVCFNVTKFLSYWMYLIIDFRVGLQYDKFNKSNN